MTTQSPAVVGSAVLDARTLRRVAFIIGVSFFLGCLVLAAGIWFALDHAAARLGRSVQDHGASVTQAGHDVGTALNVAATAIDRHGQAVAAAGATIAKPEIKIVGDVPIKQPVEVRGPNSDGALPVNATIGK